MSPGECITVKKGEIIRKSQWYKLPCFDTEPEKMSVNEAISGTYNKLSEAVERQMVSDVPLGAFLSGGLDSSAIVSCASNINPDINCFTIKT